MRWPWVSRSTYDVLVQIIEQAKTAETQLMRSYMDLLEKYHALKVQGASIPEAPKPAATVDPVSAAITQAARHDPRLRSLMAKEAARMRDAQYPDTDIIEAIQNGVTSIEGLPA